MIQTAFRLRGLPASSTFAAAAVALVLLAGAAGCSSPGPAAERAAAEPPPAASPDTPPPDTMSLDALADSLAPEEAARYAFRGRDGKGKDGPLAKIGYDLALLYFTFRSSSVGSDPSLRGSPSLEGMRVSGGRVVVDATARGEAAALRGALERLGLQQSAAYGSVVSGAFPINALPQAARLETLRGMSPSRMRAPDPVTPALPPGTIRARVAVRSCDEGEQVYVCMLEIKKAVGYGASVPAIPSGSTHEAVFGAGLFEHAEVSATTALRSGQVLEIMFRPGSPAGETDAPWRVGEVSLAATNE